MRIFDLHQKEGMIMKIHKDKKEKRILSRILNFSILIFFSLVSVISGAVSLTGFQKANESDSQFSKLTLAPPDSEFYLSLYSEVQQEISLTL